MDEVKNYFRDLGLPLLSNKALVKISKESKGCVESAVDVYMNDSFAFDSMHDDDIVILKSSKRKQKSIFPMKIGEFVVMVNSTIKETNINLDGCPVKLYKSEPVKLSKKVKSSFYAARSSQSIIRVNATLNKSRYETIQRDVAKLDPVTAQFIEKLMDMNICSFDGVIVAAPTKITLQDEIILSLNVSLTQEAFFIDSNETVDSKLRTKFEMNETKVNDKRSALIHLFKKLNFTFKSRMMAEPMHIDLTQPDTVKPEGDVASDDIELTGGQLMTIYNKTKNYESTYKPLLPKSAFLLTLKPYQETALGFLTMKETALNVDGDMLSLSPLFEEFKTPESSTPIYFSPFNGTLTLQKPTQQHCQGGILSDEMGLGKTIEILSLVHSQRFDKRRNTIPNAIRSTLVICPVNLLEQWKNEVLACIDENADDLVEIYHGCRDADRSFSKNSRLVVLTTYQTLASEFKSLELSSALYKPHWHRVVLDEAHYIKDRSSGVAKACFSLNATSRWAVTGTPVINKLEDLFSLVYFLRIEPWNNASYWKTFISDPFAKKEASAIKLAQSIMEPIILRRTKDMKDENGEFIVKLNKKTVNIEYLTLKSDEREIYDKLLARSKLKLHMLKGAGKLDYTRLRQICDHQSLLPEQKDDEEIKISDFDSLVNESNNAFSNDVRGDIVAQKESECPLCLENLTGSILLPCLHRTCEVCIEEYLTHLESKGEPGTCPVCRAPCSSKDIFRVCEDTSNENDTESKIKLIPIAFNTSTKLTAIMNKLKEIRDEGIHKTIVFSQWTSMLDVVQTPLKIDDFKFVRLDGSMSQKQRASTIKKFKEDSSVTVLLASLKSCGVGLNLTMASRAILIDPWWNEAVELQAIDRIHRIGQNKDVEITRFIISNSIEEKMLVIQRRKSGIAGFITSPDDSKITIDDLIALLA